MVGRARFELAVSWSQTRRFTELSHRPTFDITGFVWFEKCETLPLPSLAR
jgi:hypothetical protein